MMVPGSLDNPLLQIPSPPLPLPTHSLVARYGMALFGLGVALGCRVLLTPMWGTKFPFITLYPAVLVSTWYGGVGPGLLTLALGMPIAEYLWLEPVGQMRLADPADLIGMMVSLGVCLLILHLTAARQRALQAQVQLSTVLATVSHRLQTHLRHMPLAVIEWDHDFRVRQWSSQAEHLFGWTTEEVVGKTLQDWRFIFPDDEIAVMQSVHALLADAHAFRVQRHEVRENRNYTKSGAVVHCRWQNSFVIDEAGRMLSTLSLVQDLTAQRQAEVEREQLLAEVQRGNAELQHFAYIVSHDLLEPLRTMRSFVQLLARETQGKLDASADEYMTFIMDAAQRMQQMLTDLLTYTRVGQTPEFHVVHCEEVLAQVLHALQTRIEECQATITHDPLPIVWSDAARLGQVWQNLLGNALKFCEGVPHIHISAVQEAQHWRFTVRDNGIGIDPKQAERIFQVFQRLHTRKQYPGTGIGLAIGKRIVEQHGGRIWVESKPGQGTTFFFTLPAAQEIRPKIDV